MLSKKLKEKLKGTSREGGIEARTRGSREEAKKTSWAHTRVWA